MTSKNDVILPQVGTCPSCGGETIREARLAVLEKVYANNYVR